MCFNASCINLYALAYLLTHVFTDYECKAHYTHHKHHTHHTQHIRHTYFTPLTSHTTGVGAGADGGVGADAGAEAGADAGGGAGTPMQNCASPKKGNMTLTV